MDDAQVLAQNPEIAQALRAFRQIDSTGRQMTALSMMAESMDRDLIDGAEETLAAARNFGIGVDENTSDAEVERGHERAQAVLDFYDALDEIE